MKKCLLLLLVALGAMSCDDDDDNIKNIPEGVRSSFNERYPNAKQVEWEQKNGFYVADFRNDGCDTDAWFDNNGIWYMTETDVPFDALPEVVKSTFKSSQYGSWRVDDVDKLEKNGLELLYVIEAEQGEQEVALNYSADGVLVREIVGGDDDMHYPDPLPNSSVTEFILKKYSGAAIMDIETDARGVEVDIIHDGKSKEVLFDKSNVWVSTSWEVAISSLPTAVQNTVHTNYPNATIDDADYFEIASGAVYYLIELDPTDIKLKVTPDGVVL